MRYPSLWMFTYSGQKCVLSKSAAMSTKKTTVPLCKTASPDSLLYLFCFACSLERLKAAQQFLHLKAVAKLSWKSFM
jgi:hypothetical protein